MGHIRERSTKGRLGTKGRRGIMREFQGLFKGCSDQFKEYTYP